MLKRFFLKKRIEIHHRGNLSYGIVGSKRESVDFWRKYRSIPEIDKPSIIQKILPILMLGSTVLIIAVTLPALLITEPQEPSLYSDGKKITVINADDGNRFLVDNVLYGTLNGEANNTELDTNSVKLQIDDASTLPEDNIEKLAYLGSDFCGNNTKFSLSSGCYKPSRASKSLQINSEKNLYVELADLGVDEKDASIWAGVVNEFFNVNKKISTVPIKVSSSNLSLIDNHSRDSLSSDKMEIKLKYISSRINPDEGKRILWLSITGSDGKRGLIVKSAAGKPVIVNNSTSVYDHTRVIDIDLSSASSINEGIFAANIPEKIKKQSLAFLLPRVGVGQLARRARLRIIYGVSTIVHASNTTGESEQDNIDSNLRYAAFDADNGSVFLYNIPNLGKSDLSCFDQDGVACSVNLLPYQIYRAGLTDTFRYRTHPVTGNYTFHKGIDIGMAQGQPIYAAAAGKVSRAGKLSGYGNYIKIQHYNKYATAYAHMLRFVPGLKKGDTVYQGQLIGWVGATGVVTGPHLHYEIFKEGKQVDPLAQQKVNIIRGETLEYFNKYRASFDALIAKKIGSMDNPRKNIVSASIEVE